MKVVEDDERAREHEERVGRRRETSRRPIGESLDEPHHVVAEVTDGPAPEIAELRHNGRSRRLDQASQIGKWINRRARIVPPVLLGPVFDDTVGEPPRRAWLGAEERVARPRLSSGGCRLQQKCKGSASQLGEGGYRSVSVEQTILPHGDELRRRRSGVEILEAHRRACAEAACDCSRSSRN